MQKRFYRKVAWKVEFSNPVGLGWAGTIEPRDDAQRLDAMPITCHGHPYLRRALVVWAARSSEEPGRPSLPRLHFVLWPPTSLLGKVVLSRQTGNRASAPSPSTLGRTVFGCRTF